MTSHTADTAVRTSVVVSASQEHAFSVFTEGIGSWWPPEHHILQGELAEMVFEPHVGGAVYDRATNGTECRWGRVLAYEPPHRFVITWNINLQWQLESDPARVSEIEVSFLPESATTTRVSNSPTAILTATAPAGSRCGMPWDRLTAGSVGSLGLPSGQRWPALSRCDR